MVREAAVAGQFYPGESGALTRMLETFVPKSKTHNHARGVISPHAGYIYSGAIAAETLASIAIPERVIILGPNHHGVGESAALYSDGFWRTPLGDVIIDSEFAIELLGLPSCIRADTVAHKFEHSLEVQLPILQYLRPNISIVPLCVSHMTYGKLEEIAEALATVIELSDSASLIVASSDMTHFESSESAKKKDLKALEYVLNLDPRGLYNYVTENHISMCGVIPSVIMLLAVKRLGSDGADVARLVRYGNSGEVSGDFDSVVGYAGVVIG